MRSKVGDWPYYDKNSNYADELRHMKGLGL
jgi:hypothetical protein